jgi:chaperonin GroEL (HSP60 family)
VGTAGLVEVTEGHELGLRVDIRQGFGFDAKPVVSAGLETMGPVHLIVANEVIRDFRSLAPVIEGFARSDKSLVIAVRGLEDQALQLIERNRQAGVLKVAALVPRDAGPRAAEILEDLAIATGAVLVSDHAGVSLDALKPAMLGRAESYRREGTLVTLTGVAGDPALISPRLREIEAEISARRYLPLDREHAQQRHARLSGHWAELRIGARGGAGDAVAQARRALASIRSARDGGVIDGGGRGLDRIAVQLEARPAGMGAAATALTMLMAALRAPGICLRQNSGEAEPFRTGPVTDPAGLSRSLLDVALSLAGRLAGLEGAVIRH